MRMRKVVEEAAMRGHFFPQKRQRPDDTSTRLGERKVAALCPDAQSRQPEAGSSDACNNAVVVYVHVATVFHKTSFGVRLLNEEVEVRLFKVFQELIVFA